MSGLIRNGFRSFSSGNFHGAKAAVEISKESLPRWNISETEEGIRVVSLDEASPIVHLVAAINGGSSESESYDNAGVSQALRLSSGLSTKSFSQFGLTRNLQQMGTSVHCSQNRQSMYYSMSINRDLLDKGVDFFVQSFSEPAFKPWEVADFLPGAIENEPLDAVTLCQENLLKASYRTGLGNSLVCPKRNIGNIDSEMLSAFHSDRFKCGNVTLGVLGTDHPTAEKIAKIINLPSGTAPLPAPSRFIAGEHREDTFGPNAVISFGAEMTGLKSGSSGVDDYILSLILGDRTYVKRGNGAGKLQKALKDTLGSTPHGVSSLYQEFTNTGVIGATVITDFDSAGKAVNSIVSTLKTLKVTDEDVVIAKKKAKIIMASHFNERMKLLQGHVVCASHTGSVDVDKFISAFDSISTAEVQAAAERLSKAKLSMSAIGNLGSVPYSDAL